MTHYQALNVPLDSSPDEIKSAFRKLAMQHHPDKGGDPHLFDAIQKAYSTLSDPTRKMEYDSSLKRRPVHDLKELATQLAKQFCNA
jgi:curved DNA-binding protein CbpA